MGNFDEYFPFDPGYGASANSARWRKMSKLWAPDGVVMNYPTGVVPTACQLYASAISGGATTIQPGAVFIHGFYAELQNPQTISALGTNGTIVAQANFNTEAIQIYYKDGALDYGTSPTNNYEQDNEPGAVIWEIPLWLVSGTTLTDLRNLISPAYGIRWAAAQAAVIPISSGSTSQNTIMTARVPYAAQGFLEGTLLLTFSDLSQAQSVICQMTYQWGQSDQQVSTTITPAISGGGPAGQSLSIPVALTGNVPISQGKKVAGWRVTAGTGPQISIASLTLGLVMAGQPPVA
jgi:hypothetical protein